MSTKKTPAQIEFRPLSGLVPYARNARKHPEQQILQIMASLVEFGFTNPVIADADGIVAGHGRCLAAQRLYDQGKKITTPSGYELPAGTVPVIDCTGWSKAKRRAYIIADNQLALNAEWDLQLLGSELVELRDDFGIDPSLLGFSPKDLDGIGMDANPGLTDPDDTPDPPAEPKSQRGQIYLLGNHRLMCGDSTMKEDVERLLAGVKPLLMVTDPPYGVSYDPNWRNEADRANGKPYGARAVGLVSNDDRADWTEAYELFPGDVAYVWHPAGATQMIFYQSLISANFDIRMQIIWAKSHFPIGRGNYHVQHEPCWYAVRKKATANWTGDRKQSTLWHIDKPQKSETGHSTQKPVECMKRPIENNSSPGQAVYEPFSGSGTTIIAGEMTGRSVYAMEISPTYVDVAVERWEKFTGKKAVLEEK